MHSTTQALNIIRWAYCKGIPTLFLATEAEKAFNRVEGSMKASIQALDKCSYYAIYSHPSVNIKIINPLDHYQTPLYFDP